jgi:arylsulfatase A-like enzyme
MRATGRPPNIVFLLVDCLRSRSVFRGSTARRLKAIGTLVAEGASFPETVATATVTTPSMGSLFTGTLPHTHGIRGLNEGKLDPELATMAEILRDHGYHTHAEATGPVVPQFGFDRGFASFHHRDADDENVYTSYWDRLELRLKSLMAESPWFLYLHLFELHEFAVVPRAFNRRRFGNTSYERALVALDNTRLSRLLEIIGPETLVILTADHGELVPRFHLPVRIGERVGRQLGIPSIRRYFEDRHGHGNHVTEDLVLVPLILRGPGVPRGLRVDASVRHVDVFPTVLELAGVDDPRASQGVGESLAPFFLGRGRARPGYSEALDSRLGYPRPIRIAVRQNGWKYAETLDGSARWLWRLPDERRDVSAMHPSVADRMRALLGRFRPADALARDEAALTVSEQAEVETHLRGLGYID